MRYNLGHLVTSYIDIIAHIKHHGLRVTRGESFKSYCTPSSAGK